MDTEPIPISALQHAVYCLRQAALIHIERAWEENRLTAEGRILHENADAPGKRYSRGVRRVAALPLASQRLGLTGVADIVEFHRSTNGETPYPIEYKRGKPKPHRADEVQLCAQALCLEEMTGQIVVEGSLFYGETRRRMAVVFDEALRALTEDTVKTLKATIQSGKTPPAHYERRKCSACSLIEICRPQISGRSALAWRTREIEAILAEDPQP